MPAMSLFDATENDPPVFIMPSDDLPIIMASLINDGGTRFRKLFSILVFSLISNPLAILFPHGESSISFNEG